MNNPEFKSINISEEEIGALRRYISNAHISMNALIDVDPQVINKQQSKGWVIDFSKKSIDENIEYLTKLYSAIYKYSLKSGGDKTTVYRGTSRSEVVKLKSEKVSGRFLSTTTDKDIAMRFTEYKNGALFTMYLDNVPYIPTDEFLDETQFSESEILVSPFSKIEDIESYSFQDIEGVERYSAKVKKQEFSNITDEEKKQYEENISSFNFEENLSRYKELKDKAEIMIERIEYLRGAKTKEAKEEFLYMMDKQNELLTQLQEVENNFKTVKHSFNMILKDRFKTVELEIDRALELDKMEFENEERKRKIKLERNRKAELLKESDTTIQRVSNVKHNYETMDDEEKNLYDKAYKLDLHTSNLQSIDNETLVKFEELKQKMEEIKKEIEDIEISDELTKEELAPSGKLNQKLNLLYEKLTITNKVMNECEMTISATKQKNKENLSKNIAMRLGEDITAKIKEDLLKQEHLLAKKDSLWDKITGKSKVKTAQRENLKLRRKFIEQGGLNIPKTMEEMTVYVAKYKEILGDDKLPESLREIIPESKENVVITKSEREMLEVARTNTALIPSGTSKKQILFALDEQNKMLKTHIQETYTENSSNIKEDLKSAIKNSVEKCLNTALFYTKDLSDEKNREILHDRITL